MGVRTYLRVLKRRFHRRLQPVSRGQAYHNGYRSANQPSKLTWQIGISALILVLVFIIGRIEWPITHRIEDGLRYILTTPYDWSGAWQKMADTFGKAKGLVPVFGGGGEKEPLSDREPDKGTSLKAPGAEPILLPPQAGPVRPATVFKPINLADRGMDNGGPDRTSPAPAVASVSIAAPAASTAMILPVKAPVGSFFGPRLHPILKKTRMHNGWDFEANSGEPVYAVLDGTVIYTGFDKTGFGNVVKIAHEGNLLTLYAHNSRVLVKAGQKVKQGEKIAEVGDTGLSLGPHLHFEIQKNGKPVDPKAYLPHIPAGGEGN